MFRVIKAIKIQQDTACKLPSYLKDLGVLPGEEHDNRERYAEMVKIDVAFIDLQNKLCEAMGLRHCLDFDTIITKDKIEENKAEIANFLKEISDLTLCKFSIDPRKLEGMEYKAFLGKLNSELSNFGQLKLKAQKEKVRVRRNGTDITIPSYKLVWRKMADLELKDLILNSISEGARHHLLQSPLPHASPRRTEENFASQQ